MFMSSEKLRFEICCRKLENDLLVSEHATLLFLPAAEK